MSQRDYNRQVAKRQRIRKGTLIVGYNFQLIFSPLVKITSPYSISG
jgi:hypothetical protein